MTNKQLLTTCLVILIVSAAFVVYVLKGSSVAPKNDAIGGQKDEYGCLSGAGYSWCGAKNTCIRQWEEYCTSAAPKSVTFACDDAKNIGATFYPGDDKFVDLKLGDGRNMTVPHAISASGARYANADETFVFWNKGDTAFVTEGTSSALTYSNCALKVAEPVSDGLDCHDSVKYLVIEKSLSPSAGSDILVKYKSNPDQNIVCAYTVASGDFEIKNAMAEYFLAFTDNFLVLDKGTAPEPRGLIAYDLRSRKIIFTDSYAKPVTVQGDDITYFSRTSIKPTLQNCPDLKMYTSNGLGAVIMSKVTVNLKTLEKKDIGISECKATQ